MLHHSITTWPTNRRISIVAVETMSRALNATLSVIDYSNVTAAVSEMNRTSKYYALCCEVQGHNLCISCFYDFRIPYFSAYKTEALPFQNDPKNLDPSYKTDLDL